MVNKNYVFPRRERIDFIISYIVLFVVIVAWELAVIYRNYNYGEKNDDLYINIVRLMFIFIILNPLRHKKYRFSKFKFEDDSVSIICGNVIRTVKRKEKFNISVMSLRYMYRYGGKISKFIVIWKDGHHEPENEASPYVTLRRYETIVLPYEKKFLEELFTCLGVENIPIYPEIITQGDGSPP